MNKARLTPVTNLALLYIYRPRFICSHLLLCSYMRS
jgi:hypothetical protein